MNFLKESFHFEWDLGNQDKNFLKHQVMNTECEEVFFDPHKRVLKELLHAGGTGQEIRYILIGKTKTERVLYIVFTLRKDKIRVISARDLNRKERGLLP